MKKNLLTAEAFQNELHFRTIAKSYWSFCSSRPFQDMPRYCIQRRAGSPIICLYFSNKSRKVRKSTFIGVEPEKKVRKARSGEWGSHKIALSLPAQRLPSFWCDQRRTKWANRIETPPSSKSCAVWVSMVGKVEILKCLRVALLCDILIFRDTRSNKTFLDMSQQTKMNLVLFSTWNTAFRRWLLHIRKFFL